MSKLRFAFLSLLPVLLVLSTVRKVESTTIEKMRFDDIVNRSFTIVIGDVVEMERSIKYPYLGFVEAKIQVTRVISGQGVDTTSLLRVDGLQNESEGSSTTAGALKTTLGEKSLFCLALRSDGVFEVTGAFQGKFTIVGQKIQGTSMAVEDFVKHIQDLLTGKQRAVEPDTKTHPGATPFKISQVACGGDGISYLWESGKRWPDYAVNPTVYINPTGAVGPDSVQLTFAQAKKGIQRGFQAWVDAPESYLGMPSFVEDNSKQAGNDPYSVMSWAELPVTWGAGTGNWYYDSNGYTIAADVTYQTRNKDVDSLGNIIDYGLLKYNWDPDNPNYPPAPCNIFSPTDLADVAAHENGHFWGLDHVSDPMATMYPGHHRCDTLWRTLEAGDKEGAAFLNREASGTISANVTWCSGTPAAQIHVVGNTTVSSGVALTINSGAIVKFANAVSLVSNGVLNAGGTPSQAITFMPIGSTWGSIVFNGSGASGSTLNYVNMQHGTNVQAVNTSNITIQHSTFSSNSGGISFTNSSGSVLYSTIPFNVGGTALLVQNGSTVNSYCNTIYSNGVPQNTGIWYYGGSSGHIGQNDIDRFFYGINISNSCSPQFANYPYSYSRNNRIAYNFDGIVITNNSYPIMYNATNCNGYNSIHDNYGYDISLYNESYYLDALGVYWNNGNPNNGRLYAGSGCAIYTTPYLTTDPWAGIPLPSIRNIPQSPTNQSVNGQILASIRPTGTSIQMESTQDVSVDSSITDPLSDGIRLRDESKFKEAEDFFVSYLGKHPDYQRAYVELYNCYNNETAGDITRYFETLPKAASKEQKLLLSYLYVKQGNIKSAKDVDNAIAAANSNTPLAVRAELNNFYIALYNENDPVLASSILSDVMSSKDLLAPLELGLAQNALRTYVDPKTGNMPNPSIGQGSDGSVTVAPVSDGLMMNYPNPFNPSTMISYKLSSAGHVTLKVYDILGREVITLVDEYQEAGVHIAHLNGQNLASGVYFYHLTAPGISQVKKMMMIK